MDLETGRLMLEEFSFTVFAKQGFPNKKHFIHETIQIYLQVLEAISVRCE